jgi:two-component system NtrC family sensor kinase
VTIEDVNVHTVVSGVLTLVGQNLQEDLVETQIDIPQNFQVRGDFGRLQQVLLDLVMNSICAMRQVPARERRAPHRLTLSASRDEGEKARILVQDTGCGISPQNMKKIFSPFFTTKDIGQGMGLGLPMVAQLAREMGAEIAVTSKLGQGTVFTVTLL